LRQPFVEILYFQGCPNHERTLELIERIAAELRVRPTIEMVEVADPQAAARLRFLGSPTVRVDGRDVEPGAEQRDDFALACRVYRSQRETAGLPAEVLIREALAAATPLTAVARRNEPWSAGCHGRPRWVAVGEPEANGQQRECVASGAGPVLAALVVREVGST